MKITPISKPSKLDNADYLNYIIRAIGIGLMSAIATIVIPIWLLIFLGPKPTRNKKTFDKMIDSDTFTNIIEFTLNNFLSIVLTSGIIFSLRYLFIKFTKERVLMISIDEKKLKCIVQKALNDINIKILPIETLKITKYELNKEGFIGNRLIMTLESNNIKININTNEEPWHWKDINSLNQLKKKIVEINPTAIYTPLYKRY